MKLLDSFAVSSGSTIYNGVEKTLTYFDDLKVQDYDLIYFEGISATYKTGCIVTPAMLSGITAGAGSYNIADASYLKITAQTNSNKITFYIGTSNTKVAGTISIYGIQL